MSSKSHKLMHDALPLTDEARDNQLYALARNLAEERLRNGQATGAEIVYLLRAGSEEEKLKKQLLNSDASSEGKGRSYSRGERNRRIVRKSHGCFP